jgi:hypothetical protein
VWRLLVLAAAHQEMEEIQLLAAEEAVAAVLLMELLM